ncbi:copper resistance protein CopC [Streptomyces sp. NPDC093252]|uniref:copper resistance CopC/CopD family protein n=1 Tax=Streptomyces sp. NPDC093252 TaxID=3154980 RepID=UPI00344AB9F9
MVLLAALPVLLLAGAGPASAHAAPRSTTPADGSVVATAPSELTLTFTESVGLLEGSIRIYDPGNHRLRPRSVGHAPGSADTLRIALPATGLDRGTYTVAWRVVSSDSHPVSGAFTFSIGAPSPAPPAVDTGPPENRATGALQNTARYLAYLAGAVLIGVAAFALLCRPPGTGPLRPLLRTAWWTLLVTTFALLLLRAPYEAGTGPATAFDPGALTRTLSGRPGILLAARLLLLVPAALLLVRLSRRRTPVLTGAAAVVAVGLAVTWSAAEHASAGIQVPVAVASSTLHLLATGVWLGGLVALPATLRGTPGPLGLRVVRRFSRIAFMAVTVLVVTGVYQSWRGLGSLSALTGTAYGRVLLLKLLAVAALLAAAGVSRRVVRGWAGVGEAEAREREREREWVREREPESVPVLEAVPEPVSVSVPVAVGGGTGADAVPEGGCPDFGDDGNGEDDGGTERRYRRALRRSVLAEAAVAAAVLLVTTVLTATLPGRAAGEAAAEAGIQVPVAAQPRTAAVTVPFDTGTPGGSGTVEITLDPARVGDNSVQAVVFGADGGLTILPELRLSFTLPDKELGPIDAELTDRGGYWATDSLTLPIEGTWTMRLTVRVSELDQVSETGTLRVLP